MDGIKKDFRLSSDRISLPAKFPSFSAKGKPFSSLLGACFNEDTPFDFPGLICRAHHPSGFSTVSILATVISSNLLRQFFTCTWPTSPLNTLVFGVLSLQSVNARRRLGGFWEDSEMDALRHRTKRRCHSQG